MSGAKVEFENKDTHTSHEGEGIYLSIIFHVYVYAISVNVIAYA